MVNPQNEDKLRWQLIKQLFDQAVELDQDERRAWLVEQCGDDRELLAKVQSLLECDEESSSFLQPPLKAGDETETVEDGSARLGRRVGAYTLSRVIGYGGMGTVYAALQERPRRTVALKLMKHGIASRSALRRFEYESQILARLRHPGIAQVYEAGTHRDDTGTVPFFAMEYIVGAKLITQYVKEKKLGTRQRMELFSQVCDAVHHGHQKGIIHRDLKPGNILVDAQGQVKIIDFGVARATDSDMALTTLQTEIGQLVGTLQYMSPEQCDADPHNIDTRSDVYALGIVFYELLCERLPYNVTRVAMHEATRIIREQQPTKLTNVDITPKGDIETIVLKALEKDREHRYQSAIELAQDIRRYLNGEAIMARPPSIVYQLHIFARRHKTVVGAIAAVFVVLVGGIIVSSWQAMRATRAEKLAEQRLVESRHQTKIAEAINVFLNEDLLAAVDPDRTPNREISMREVLDAASERIEGRFENDPLIEASIRGTLGHTYQGLGLHAPAERHLREAEAILVRVLGEDDPATLRTRSELADLLRRRGWFLQAESLARQTLEVQRRVLGHDHTSTVFTLNALGLVLRRQGKYEEAERVFRQTLEIRKRTLGHEHLDTLMSMSNLAGLLAYLGRCDEAEPLHRKALKARRRLLSDEHPRTLASMSGLGLVLRCQGKREEAEATIRQVINLKRRTLGDEHPDTLQSMYDLAVFLFSSGRLDEAEELLKPTLEARRRVLGVAHLSVASTTDQLLRILRARAKVEEARPYVARLAAEADEARYEDLHANPYEIHARAYAYVTYEPIEFRDPVEALRMMENLVEMTGGTPGQLRTLAIVYEQNGRLDDAIGTLRRGLAQLEQGESYWRAVFETRLIDALRSKGDWDGAETVFSDSLARTLGATVESQRPRTEFVREMMQLAVFLAREDRFLQHEWFCEDLAEARQGKTQQAEPGIAGFVIIYASALVAQERYAEAEPYLRHCWRIRELALPEGDWHTAHVMSVLGASLAGQEKFDQAEPLLLSGYNQMKDNTETIPDRLRDERLRQSLDRIVRVYEAWDAAEHGKGYAEKVAQWREKVPQEKAAEATPP